MARHRWPLAWPAGVAAALAAALLAGCGSQVPLTARPPAAQPAPAAAVGSPAATPLAKARNWDEYKRQAARRLVDSNPEMTYMSEVQQPLLAIPVLEIELNADGSVRHIKVARKPGQALDTIDLAIAAVRRAAPFGDVRHLPRPWVYSEVFLFNEERRFKPRLLDD
jgi:protein TonB